MKSIFITGTDTEVGKTHVSSLLIKYIKQFQKAVTGFKPIAAGAERAFGELVNEDALTLMESGNVALPYKLINPYVFEPPIAPHIAAKQVGVTISKAELSQHLKVLNQQELDHLIVEGAGGWALPINDTDLLSEWVADEGLPVIMVVGLKLGCLNHALLTLSHIKQSGAKCVGWIANYVDEHMLEQDENLATLKARLDCPLLAIAPNTQNEKPKLQVYKELNTVLKLDN
ncbi:dethiobiotin synthase [Pseudoalteromonas sp. SSM20]|uniref:dethiobiotin synthase n=1 Tax=Pseudoalteromonas sp. SSM20 TaxID=3139394 RepID=UPI003BACBD44